MKTSFVLHNDSLFILDELTDEQAGQLFKAIKAYHLGQEYKLDFALNLVFILFKNQFERDNENYLKRCVRNAENGSKGGRPKKANESEKTQSVILKPKKADSDNDSDNDNKTIPEFSEFLEYALLKKPRVNQQDVRLKYESWKENNWSIIREGKYQPILNWKSTLLNTLPHIKEIVINVQRQIID